MRRVQSENEKRNMIGPGLRHLLVEVTVLIRRNTNFKCPIIQIVTGYIRSFVFTLKLLPTITYRKCEIEITYFESGDGLVFKFNLLSLKQVLHVWGCRLTKLTKVQILHF